MAETTTWFSPTVAFASVGSSEYDECMDWTATLTMSSEDDPDNRQAVGLCDFLTVRMGAGTPISLILDQFDEDCMLLEPLFAGDRVSPEVGDDPDATECFESLLIREVRVAEPFRGHDLGLWLVTELIARMTRPYTFVAVAAASMEFADDLPPLRRVAAAERLAKHWERAGLQRVARGLIGEAVLLAGNASFIHFEQAREALASVSEVAIDGPARIDFENPSLDRW